jgi:hypothetical protein
MGDGEADDTVDEKAQREIDQETRVEAEPLPNAGEEHERIQRVPDSDRGSELDPAAWVHWRMLRRALYPESAPAAIACCKVGATNA